MPRVYKQKARKPIVRGGQVVVRQGQEYYKWKFYRQREWNVSVTYPTPRQLTRNEHALRCMDFEEWLDQLQKDAVSGQFSLEELQSSFEDLQMEMEEYRDELH